MTRLRRALLWLDHQKIFGKMVVKLDLQKSHTHVLFSNKQRGWFFVDHHPWTFRAERENVLSNNSAVE